MSDYEKFIATDGRDDLIKQVQLALNKHGVRFAQPLRVVPAAAATKAGG